ncbi:hypothetical protein EMIHUDRAFT_252746 [Emiliania huxleyi CCMP1516]|uniref:Raptor N-terminal CASPase-like domain-containing protein n=2 Tax=Emiliania huxleyi TaxID=2903 RepID=A0A0D3KGC5_EMIH1|nr:hypothetical protein EMIHUDRAFT_252746 [Emiliania huxleyi CCMP1516]EOD34810.1 hypothetical protein EMIHUDRAFT_252746 [Emiliania huxleyi CCMP1516]|eukprot:XP_005787239.1 hypothetical protein EMIHUDRAFT_252746 [Emiliania huxleyi CCMP1516]
MGRHTLHVDAEAKVSHYVCDYTGIPMKGPGCFMPFWKTPTSRMTKRGNYCCWEAVLQHARATADRDILPKVERRMLHEHQLLLALPDEGGWPGEERGDEISAWRMRERMKTPSLVLVLALNIGVDPPDVTKPTPCARLECWLDPLAGPVAGQKAIEAIATALQQQYEQWQPRGTKTVRACLDPTAQEVRKWCASLRRASPGRDERLLLHFNGHGVPRPTVNGEVWLFNRTFTQYHPVSILDLLSWLGTPCVLVFDCHNAGRLNEAPPEGEGWHSCAVPLTCVCDPQALAAMGRAGEAAPKVGHDVIVLSACAAHEELPTSPELPADLFTACLTSPLRVALSFVRRDGLVALPDELLERRASLGISAHLGASRRISARPRRRVPGSPSERRTPAGELNWIFTADMLLASLCRNFLLAQRVFARYDLHPISSPPLPEAHGQPPRDTCRASPEGGAGLARPGGPSCSPSPPAVPPSSFFTEQLTAFEVWLSRGAADAAAPEQLPILLQVLLSPTHRYASLLLLGRYVSLGPFAVRETLGVGIFPYVLKLLSSSPTAELSTPLLYLWAATMLYDRSTRIELLNHQAQPQRTH